MLSNYVNGAERSHTDADTAQDRSPRIKRVAHAPLENDWAVKFHYSELNPKPSLRKSNLGSIKPNTQCRASKF
jgi:hypothetical protein